MNPNKDVLETKWDEFRRKVLNWRNKHRNDQLIKVNSAQERSIRILQKRYGYTREKATSELKKHYSKAWLG
ncbi:MAG TPA: hypothetical protein VFZ43_06450 [Anaerolineales bacterium]